MIEEYRISIQTGRAVPTGTYRKTNRGTMKAVTRYMEEYVTPAGTFRPEEWKRRALEAVKADGEMELLEKVKDHCRHHCCWLRSENEIEEYALSCLCDRSYRAWEEFEDTETVIWM